MVDRDDLAAVSKSLGQAKKPKMKTTSSLDGAIRRVNFGVPKTSAGSISNDKLKPVSKKPSAQAPKGAVKIKLTSPTIKKQVSKAPHKEEKLVQEADIDKIISHEEFAANSISFIPYGAGFLTAQQALEKINSDPQHFKILQENFLSEESLKFVIEKIDKIYDLSGEQKEKLHSFYINILSRRSKNHQEIERAKEIFSKIKAKSFRSKLGEEISRMIPRSGALYKYYASFDLVDSIARKNFLTKISQIDTYILKKIKELITFNQVDLYYRHQEIILFSEILAKRNILMSSFHKQVEHLLAQKKSADSIKEKSQSLISQIKQIAQDFGRRGKFGSQISRSRELTNKIKTSYFVKIQTLIDAPLTRLQKTVFDLELGNYVSLENIKQRISDIDATEILHKCREIYDKYRKG